MAFLDGTRKQGCNPNQSSFQRIACINLESEARPAPAPRRRAWHQRRGTGSHGRGVSGGGWSVSHSSEPSAWHGTESVGKLMATRAKLQIPRRGDCERGKPPRAGMLSLPPLQPKLCRFTVAAGTPGPRWLPPGKGTLLLLRVQGTVGHSVRAFGPGDRHFRHP